MDGDNLRVDLEYPRSNNIKSITVSLLDVRAADDLNISYDFDRDGWVIRRDIGYWTGESLSQEWVVTEENAEIAFIPAWSTKD